MLPTSRIQVTFASVLSYSLVALVCVGLLLYVLFQARLLIGGPQVALSSELPTIQTERKITLTGNASNITTITLNGRPIQTDQAGYFEEPVILENGYTIISIRAEDRYGRETTLTREFVFTPRSLLET